MGRGDSRGRPAHAAASCSAGFERRNVVAVTAGQVVDGQPQEGQGPQVAADRQLVGLFGHHHCPGSGAAPPPRPRRAGGRIAVAGQQRRAHVAAEDRPAVVAAAAATTPVLRETAPLRGLRRGRERVGSDPRHPRRAVAARLTWLNEEVDAPGRPAYDRGSRPGSASRRTGSDGGVPRGAVPSSVVMASAARGRRPRSDQTASGNGDCSSVAPVGKVTAAAPVPAITVA